MIEGIPPQETATQPKDEAMEKVRAFRGLLAAGDVSLKTAVETSGFSVNDPETALDIMATVNIRASFEPVSYTHLTLPTNREV